MARMMSKIVLLLALFFAGSLHAYNKQRAKHFEWKILSTPHFEIYFYPEEEELAQRAALIAEKGYLNNSRLLDYFAKEKIPLFLYQSHLEFQQTNISREVIGPGTGGFTEGFKNRMVLPTMGSEKWLEVVIVHELAHATQFNILYGEGSRSWQVLRNYVIPLWVMEGMAEYCAHNWDSYSDMVMRDAVLNDRIPDLDMMDGFSHLDEVYVAYKAGQTAIQFLSDTQGAASVARLMKKFKAQISVGQVLRDVTGKSYGQFNREWKASLRQKYWSKLGDRKPAGAYAKPLTRDDSSRFTHSNGSTWSPDGRHLAYVTTLRGREEIWVMDADGKNAHALFEGPFEEIGRSGPYGVPGQRLSWSPSGDLIAFIQARAGRKRLTLGSVDKGTLKEVELPFDEISAPRFSPDGLQIALAAYVKGRSRLMSVDLKSGLSREIFSDPKLSMLADPAWSPQGDRIVFSAEEDRRNQIFEVAAQGGPARKLSIGGHDDIMPAYLDKGEKIIYSSDADGAYDLYTLERNGLAPMQHTKLVTGLFQAQPSPNGSKLLCVSYEDGCQNLYVMDAPGYVREPPSPGLRLLSNPYLSVAKLLTATAHESGVGLPSDSELEGLSPAMDAALALPKPQSGGHYLDAEALAVTLTAQDMSLRPYRLKITPDIFFMVLAFDNFSGLVGGGYFTASDMLGDHNFNVFANFVPGYQSVFQTDYVWFKGLFSYSLAAFYRNTNYFLSGINPQQVASTFLDQDWGAAFSASYPLSAFTRLDATLGSRYLLRAANGTGFVDPVLRSTLGESLINSISLTLQRDTHTFQDYQPYRGQLLRLSTSYADKFLGGTRNFALHQFEYRFAVPLTFLSRDTVFSARALGLGQTGSDRHLFYFGGAQVRGLSYNEELAESLGMVNLQIRQPYLRNINGSLWPLDYLLIKDAQLVFYYDFGLALREGQNPLWTDVRAGYGGGIRLHTFMFEKVLLVFSFDIAQRTDRWGSTYYYFNLGQIF